MKQYKEVYVRVILFRENNDIIVESEGIDASGWDDALGSILGE